MIHDHRDSEVSGITICETSMVVMAPRCVSDITNFGISMVTRLNIGPNPGLPHLATGSCKSRAEKTSCLHGPRLLVDLNYARKAPSGNSF